MVRHALVAAGCMLLGASCTGGRETHRPLLPAALPLSPTSDFLSPRLIGADAEVEAPGNGPSWQPGDTVIYGITMRSPERQQRWLVRIEVRRYPAAVEGAGATDVLLAVETFGEDGGSQAAAAVVVPAGDLEHGPYPGCRVGLNTVWIERREGKLILGPRLTAEEQATVDRSAATLAAFFRLVNTELEPIVDTVVARPPLGDLLRHGGFVHLIIGAGILHSELIGEQPGIPPATCSFPFEVRANETLALRGHLFVAESRPPFVPGGGIVAAEAAHPERPDRTVSIRLLAARRGPPGAR